MPTGVFAQHAVLTGIVVLRTSELNFELPEELIATRAAEPRDAARMLVVSRRDSNVLEHRHVRDLPEFLKSGDLMVVNETRVLPARFEGRREETGGRLPGLYLGPAPGGEGARLWTVMLKGGHLKPGVVVELGQGVKLDLVRRSSAEPGAWVAMVHGVRHDESDAAALARVGMTPLPPYILQARKHAGVEVPDWVDRERYQTVFAKEGGGNEHPGSVAAPTAGMHLPPELLGKLAAAGVGRASVVLQVGTGTFKPVETEFVEQHPMHEEWCSIPWQTVEAIHAARGCGGRILCVGTTTARALESQAIGEKEGWKTAREFETRLLVTPGHRWLWVDMMLTNFHLPQSTLLAMVASLFDGGLDRLKEIYGVAIAERYRFFSYGDAMLILP